MQRVKMKMILEDICILMSRELESLANEIELFPNDEIIWNVIPGITNSAGNLTLHVCGNLKYFIGSVLGNTGYIRDRDLEFSRKSGSQSELVSDLRNTKKVIQTVLPKLSETTFAESYPKTVGGVDIPCHRFLIHLATHLSFHVGQVGYLRRILTGNKESSGAVSPGFLSD